MQDLIKRYFWVLGVVTVIVCSLFAAKATGHILEAKFLGDPAHGPKITPVVRPPEAEPIKPSGHAKDGSQLVARDMFCSECTPAPVVSSDPSSVAITSLPLV